MQTGSCRTCLIFLIYPKANSSADSSGVPHTRQITAEQSPQTSGSLTARAHVGHHRFVSADCFLFSSGTSGIDIQPIATHPVRANAGYILTSTSSADNLTSNTSTFARGEWTATPVFTSKAQACHGQMSLPSSTMPCPSGPPRCGHTLSMAASCPFEFAMQITLPAQSASRASPGGGSSEAAITLTNSDIVQRFRGSSTSRFSRMTPE